MISMPPKRGCGVIFYSKARQTVVLFRRDDKPEIPFPNHIDILGGAVDKGENPKQAVKREMAEELLDRRTGSPYSLLDPVLFREYTDVRGTHQSIFCKEMDFSLDDIELLEGQELVEVTRDDVDRLPIAFEFDEVILRFFDSEHMR